MKNRIFQDLMVKKKPQKLGRFFFVSVFIHCIFIYGMMTVKFEPAATAHPFQLESSLETSSPQSTNSSNSSVAAGGEHSSPPAAADGASEFTFSGHDIPTTPAEPGVLYASSDVSQDTSPGASQGYAYSYRDRGGHSDLVETDDYIKLYRKPFNFTGETPRSSFSTNVGTLSYPRIRQAIRNRRLPELAEVRIEEMINYFQYDYPPPVDGHPISIVTELSGCPWNPSNRLLHIGLKGKVVFKDELKNSRFTIAKDVKIQVFFNPERVKAYRLIGYGSRTPKVGNWKEESRFSGDMRAAQRITSLYEIVPAVVPAGEEGEAVETATVMIGYLLPEEADPSDPSKVKWISHPVFDEVDAEMEPSSNFKFSAAVAQFGMMLLNSEEKDFSSLSGLIMMAREAVGEDTYGYRTEFIKLLEKYRDMSKH
jgi:hypothetical protein